MVYFDNTLPNFASEESGTPEGTFPGYDEAQALAGGIKALPDGKP